MSIATQAFILECLTILFAFGCGRILGIFSIGLFGRAIVLIIVYAIVSSLNPNLIYWWAGAASILMFIVGAFWRDRFILVNLFYKITNLFTGFRHRIDYNRAEKKAFRQAQEEYKQASDEAKDYSERYQQYQTEYEQAQSEYEEAKRRAEQAENYYRQKAQQAESDAKKKYDSNEKSSSERKLDPSNINEAYEILGVPNGASTKECKLAYKRLMSKFHPDKVQHLDEEWRNLAEEKCKSFTKAWSIIEKN